MSLMKGRKVSAASEEAGRNREERNPLDRDAVFAELAEAAQRFVNKTPRYRRTAQDRQHLLAALIRAQPVLSLQRHRRAGPRPLGRPNRRSGGGRRG